MSKPIKNLIVDTYKKKFDGVTGAVVIDIRGVASGVNTNLRSNLHKEGIKITIVKNNLAKRAFSETTLQRISELLDGPCAMVYGGNSVVEVARTIIGRLKEVPNLQVKGAIMDGELFAADRVEALSKYPTKVEAQAQVIQVILGAAGQLIGAVTGIGGQIASIIEQVQKKLEKGEAVAAVG
ncbi:MAG: 50S ribosomal protein L10 [Phycisphaeraceae bacterium]